MEGAGRQTDKNTHGVIRISAGERNGGGKGVRCAGWQWPSADIVDVKARKGTTEMTVAIDGKGLKEQAVLLSGGGALLKRKLPVQSPWGGSTPGLFEEKQRVTMVSWNIPMEGRVVGDEIKEITIFTSIF